MRLNLLTEHLIQKIQHFGALARDQRQVYRRLEQLLDTRFQQILKSKRHPERSASSSAREALTSQEYLDLVDEVIELGSQSLQSRVQYETHMMLYEARQTLRVFGRNRR